MLYLEIHSRVGFTSHCLEQMMFTSLMQGSPMPLHTLISISLAFYLFSFLFGPASLDIFVLHFSILTASILKCKHTFLSITLLWCNLSVTKIKRLTCNYPKQTYLLLILYSLPSFQHFSKKYIKALLNRRKDKPGHQWTKVIHNIIYTLKK